MSPPSPLLSSTSGTQDRQKRFQRKRSQDATTSRKPDKRRRFRLRNRRSRLLSCPELHTPATRNKSAINHDTGKRSFSSVATSSLRAPRASQLLNVRHEDGGWKTNHFSSHAQAVNQNEELSAPIGIMSGVGELKGMKEKPFTGGISRHDKSS